MAAVRLAFRFPIGWAARGVSLSAIGKLCTSALWVIFIIGTSSAAPPNMSGIERLFWLPVDLLVVLLFLPNLNSFLTLMLNNWIMVSWPVLAILSTLWSLSPGVTLYHGLQLLMTVWVALMLCMSTNRLRLLQIVLAAIFCLQCLSVLAVLLPRYGISPGGEWRGVFPHKNVLGMFMSLQIITAACLFLHGWRRNVCGAIIIFALGLLVMSRSGTSMLGTIVALSPLPFAICYRQGLQWLGLLLSVLMLAAGAALCALAIGDIDPFGLVLGSVGKDATLTGRTILWDIGITAFWERPLIGYGYKGYWESPDTTVQYLRLVIGQDLWFFHNNFIEVAVAFGVVGLALFVFGLAWALVKTARDFIWDREYTTLWSLLVVLFLVFLCLGENPLFSNHSLHQFFLVAALAVRNEREWRQSRSIRLRYRGASATPAPT